MRPIEIRDVLTPDPFSAQVLEPDVVPAWRGGRLSEILLQSVTAFLLLNQLSLSPIVTGAESHVAAVALEMLQRGRLWFPVINGEPIYNLPALAYLPTVLSFMIFGKTEFALRLPSILFGILQIASVRGIARRAGGPAAGRFAQLALLFMPGWLAATRQGGADPMALAFMFLGFAMTTKGTATILGMGEDTREESDGRPRWAPILSWLGAGILWGLAALARGPICFLVAIPAVATAIVTHEHAPKVRLLKRWLERPGLAVAVMIIVYAAWPLSLPASAEASRAWIIGEAPSFDLGSIGAGIRSAAWAYPVTLSLSLLGAALLAARGWARRTPDVFCWVGAILLFVFLQRDPASIFLYAIYPAAAILIGAGLLEGVRWFLAREMPGGAIAVWVLATIAVGVEFDRHFFWNDRAAEQVKPFAQAFADQLSPHLRPGESIGVIGMSAEAFSFYFNANQGEPRPVRQFSEDDWQAIRSHGRPDLVGSVRFVIAPLELMREPQNFPRSDWSIAWRSQDLVLLEYLRPTPVLPEHAAEAHRSSGASQRRSG